MDIGFIGLGNMGFHMARRLLAAGHAVIALDAYFVYPEELKSVARVQAFRDFLVSKAQRWSY